MVEILQPAAQYLRMSTEHQRYSTQNQAHQIASWAADNGYQVVRTYADEGKSGLHLKNRAGLKQLLADVIEGRVGFSAVLVYDVSRWGRFQDPDQSAHYEFLCRSAGVSVIYCAEGFTPDGGPAGALLKQLKRSMAAEFSRELGVKVAAGQSALAARGFWQGGPAGFGLRRQLIDDAGRPRGLLGPGEAKNIQSDRVVIVRGPDAEVAIVRQVYRWYVRTGQSRNEIARRLNENAVPTNLNRPWTPFMVKRILMDEAYIGNLSFRKTSNPLGAGLIRNPPEVWIRATGVVEPIISSRLYSDAQRIRRERLKRMGPAEMLAGLRQLIAQEGRATAPLIKAARWLPCPHQYQRVFGSLHEAYRLADYKPTRIGRLSRRGPWRGAIASALIARRQAAPSERPSLHSLWRELRSRGYEGGYDTIRHSWLELCAAEGEAPDLKRQWRLTSTEMLERLAALLAREGRLTSRLIQGDPLLPHPRTIQLTFGSLNVAYARLGYLPERPQARGAVLRAQADGPMT